jgi:heparan-alpha-glucosaminide N-acetyltransferase
VGATVPSIPINLQHEEKGLSANTQVTFLPYRLASIDAYRGFVMFLLLAEAFQLCNVAAAVPESSFWRFLCQQQSHAEWVGVNLHDLIMPSFCFLVGVSLPFSLARRAAQGATLRDLWKHAVIRSFLLIGLGLAIAAMHARQMIVYPFDWILPQIGLAYPALFWLALKPPRSAWISVMVILAVCWLAFALYPVPGPEFDYERVGVSQAWLKEHGLRGFEAHWQKNSNVAWAFDTWLLNPYPREKPFVGFPKGMTTLNFIPTLATMILGLMAGRILQSARSSWSKLRWLVNAGVLGLAGGWALSLTDLCPLVKAIWTPSWVLFSGGWCFLLLGCSFLLVDWWGYARLAFPFTVIGMNAIAAYLLAQIHSNLAFNALRRIVGSTPFTFLGDPYEPLIYGVVMVAGYWTALYVLYRRRLFLRV